MDFIATKRRMRRRAEQGLPPSESDTQNLKRLQNKIDNRRPTAAEIEETAGWVETNARALAQKAETLDFTSGDPAVSQLLATGLERISQYAKAIPGIVNRGYQFPAFSVYRSWLETITVMCELRLTPQAAVKRILRGESPPGRPADRWKTCRKQQYPRVYHFDSRHLAAVSAGMWKDLNSLDHFGYGAVESVAQISFDGKIFLVSNAAGSDELQLHYLRLMAVVLIVETSQHIDLLVDRGYLQPVSDETAEQQPPA